MCVTYVCACMSEGVWRRKMVHTEVLLWQCAGLGVEFGGSPGTDCSDMR